jgi:pectate lyase
VSYKPASSSTWATAPSALVRGTRVDIPGLLGNTSYNVRIDAVGVSASSTVTLTTKKYDRFGFAFTSNSPAKQTTGGYQANGTPASGVTILHITESNKNSVQLAVTKGSTTTTYTGLGAIMTARNSAKTQTPIIIRFIGKVTEPAGLDSNKMLAMKDVANITLEGIGNDAELNWGFNIVRTTNVEVRNLKFYMFYEDSVSFQDNNKNAWIHHNDFGIGQDRGGDKSLGDGSCDIKASSSFITVAYNHFQGTGKSSLVGLNESADFFITFHHNYFEDVGSRGPRVRTGSIHIFNNYYKNQKTYCIGAAEGSSLYVQNNYFENSKRPMIIASQGSDLQSGGSTLSGENGGTIKSVGNYMDAFSAATFIPGVDDSPGPAVKGGARFNNFDSTFSSIGYTYSVDTAANARTKVIAESGRLN